MNSFAAAFFGALLAIFVTLAIVYTYVTLLLGPRLKRVFREHAAPAQAVGAPSAPSGAAGEAALAKGIVRVIFTCEDHGRCAGCPKVLAQFEAIVRHQGLESFDEVEMRCYERLREQLAVDVAMEGESEAERQKRLGARVIEALVHEGFSRSAARGVVWACDKEARETYFKWLSSARESCQKFKENVA